MNKKYKVYEVDKVGRVILWTRTLTRLGARDQLKNLKMRFPEKDLHIGIENKE